MKLFQGIALTLLFSNAVFAQQDIEVNGTTQKYPLAKIAHARFQGSVSPHYIRLLNMTLSDNAWKKLEQEGTASSNTNVPLTVQEPLPRQVQLGMGQVPVLDQGSYGTCVTFANTAAVDAAANQGDYISQLCQLELGHYLENNTGGKISSGWEGSMGVMVLTQMEHFGVVTKDIEHSIGCAGLMSYPTHGSIPANELNLPEYEKLSTNMSDSTLNVGWSSLMDFYQAFIDDTDRDQILLAVKDAIHKGDRLTFGVLLFAPNMGVVGAVGKHHVPNDTWIITPLINGMINSHDDKGGHEMIITGYDDDAVAIDDKGRTYSGLLTLRNSWGKQSGDEGNFYMSYDYFKRLTVEIQRIRGL